MKKQTFPRLTLKLAQQIAKKYYGTATGLCIDEDTIDVPAQYRRYKMQVGQLQICICYTPDRNDYSRRSRNCIQLRTYLSSGGVDVFGDSIEQYINPVSLEEDYNAEYDESNLDAQLYCKGEL